MIGKQKEKMVKINKIKVIEKTETIKISEIIERIETRGITNNKIKTKAYFIEKKMKGMTEIKEIKREQFEDTEKVKIY